MKLFKREFGTGEPLIVLHGLYGSSDNWISLAGQFQKNFRVILVDQRNHGNSPHSEVHTYDSMADDLFELFQDNGIANAYILGHSMGGKVALRFAQKYPMQVKALIIVDIAPWAYDLPLSPDYAWENEHVRIISGLNAIPIKTISRRSEADAILSYTIASEQVRNFLLKNLKHEKDGTFSWKLNIKALKANLPHLMGSVLNGNADIQGTKILFLRGELSNYIPLEKIEKLKHLFPNSEVVTIRNTSHWIHAENPKEFIESVNKFLLR